MEVGLLLMEQIAQLFIVLLMGYIVVKAKLLKPSALCCFCVSDYALRSSECVSD